MVSVVRDKVGTKNFVENCNKSSSIPVISDTTSVVALSDEIYGKNIENYMQRINA